MNNLLNEADFSFIKSGSVFIIEKDRHGVLYQFVALTEFDIICFLESNYKTLIRTHEGEIIMKNFESADSVDLTSVHELLSEIEGVVERKNKMLEEIDKALDNGDKDTFIRLTSELYGEVS